MHSADADISSCPTLDVRDIQGVHGRTLNGAGALSYRRRAGNSRAAVRVASQVMRLLIVLIVDRLRLAPTARLRRQQSCRQAS